MIRPVTILIVDSYSSARGALADLLRSNGYCVVEAHTAMEGMRAARERMLDLVIADPWPFFASTLHMVERLRRPGPTSHVPVLALTSAVSSHHRERALRAGCGAYLEKPCPPHAVLAEVRMLLHPFSTDAEMPPMDRLELGVEVN